MINASSVLAGKAFVEIGTDMSHFEKGLKGALKSMDKFAFAIGAAMGALAVAMATPIVRATKEYAKFGSEMWDISKRVGVSAESLAELGYAAQTTGSDIHYVVKGMRFMLKNLDAAMQDPKSAMRMAFERLGIDVNKFVKLKPEEQFLRIADALGKLGAGSEQTGIGMKLLGRGAQPLFSLFNQGRSVIEQLRKQFVLLHGSLNFKQAKITQLSFNKLKLTFQGLSRAIGEIASGPIKDFIDILGGIIVGIRKIIEENPFLVKSFLSLAVVIAGLSVIFGAIGVAAFLAFHPILLAILVIVAAATLLGAAFMSLLDWLGIFKSGLNDTISNIYESFNPKTVLFLRQVKQSFVVTFLGIKSVAIETFEKVSHYLKYTIGNWESWLASFSLLMDDLSGNNIITSEDRNALNKIASGVIGAKPYKKSQTSKNADADLAAGMKKLDELMGQAPKKSIFKQIGEGIASMKKNFGIDDKNKNPEHAIMRAGVPTMGITGWWGATPKSAVLVGGSSVEKQQLSVLKQIASYVKPTDGAIDFDMPGYYNNIQTTQWYFNNAVPY